MLSIFSCVFLPSVYLFWWSIFCPFLKLGYCQELRGGRLYPICKLISWPATFLWMLAENMKLMSQKGLYFSHSIWSSMSFMFISTWSSSCSPAPPWVQWGMMQWPWCVPCSQGLHHSWGTLGFRKPKSFIMSCKQTCPAFAPEGLLSLLFCIINEPALHSGGRQALFSKAICCTDNLEKIEQKTASVFVYKICRNMRDPWSVFFYTVLASGEFSHEHTTPWPLWLMWQIGDWDLIHSVFLTLDLIKTTISSTPSSRMWPPCSAKLKRAPTPAKVLHATNWTNP